MLYTILLLLLLGPLMPRELSACDTLVYPDTTGLQSVELPEVEITSMREQGRVSRLPVTATVLDSMLIEKQQLQTLKGLSTLVPNLFMPDYGSRLTSPVYIRGVGSRINAPSVGLYVDNIPYLEKSVFDFDLIDAERIEVLRGPQGTLYGRNTMGGQINVYSATPFRRGGTTVSMRAGNHTYLNGRLLHNQWLGESTGLSVSAGLNRHDGFFRNEFTGEMADAHFSAGARVRLARQFSSALHMEFTTHAEHLDQGGYPYAIHDPASGNTLTVSYDSPSSYKRQMLSNGLLFRYQTSLIEIQGVTAHQAFSDKQSIDQDFTPADLVFAVQEQQQQMLSQEFTMRSLGSNSYQWVTGLFGFVQGLDNDLRIHFGEDAVAMGMVPAGMTRVQHAGNRIWGAAAFHQSTISGFVLSDLDLTAGLRLDHESASLDHLSYLEADFAAPPPASFNSRLSFYQLQPRMALVYALTERSGVFAAMTRGYKTGGFNVVFEREEDRSFGPEYSRNYETGLRGHFFNNRIDVQAALFYIDWKNQQIVQMLPSGQGTMLSNAGASVSKGAELELNAVLGSRWLFSGNYGYTHAAFTDNAPDPHTQLSGNFIPYIPRHTLYGNLQYRHPTNSQLLEQIILRISYQGTGRHYWDQANTMVQSWYGLLNVVAGFETGSLNVDLWSNNLASAPYHAFAFAALGNQYVQQGRPATFGMNVRYHF